MAGDQVGWDTVYRNARPQDLPWFSPRIDPDIESTIQTLEVHPAGGPVLDLGTGPGTFAAEMARRGFEVVATDISESAIEMAKERAGKYAARIEWVTADLFDCAWPGRFQFIHDRGVYHTLAAMDRRRYAWVVPSWLRPAGYLLLKTFHEDEPGDWGPNRIARTELVENFGTGLKTIEIEGSTFPGTLGEEPKAWRAVFQKPKARD